MKSSKFSRRDLLKRLGLGAALVPLLNVDQFAHSATSGYPKRLIIMQWPNGVIHDSFWPKNTSSTLSELNLVTAPLEPFMKDITIIGGLETRVMRDPGDKLNGDPGGASGGHASYPFLFTGARAVFGREGGEGISWYANSISVDQYVAQAFAKSGFGGVPSLHVAAQGVYTNPQDTSFSIRGPAIGAAPNASPQVNTPEINPYALHDRLFGNYVPDDSNKSEEEAVARLRAERRSILDLVGGDIERFAANLGTDDKLKIQQHLQAIRDLEQEVGGTSPSSSALCTVPDDIPEGLIYDYHISQSNDRMLDQLLPPMMNLVVAAMRCDITRVATIQMMSPSNGTISLPWLGSEFQVGGEEYQRAGGLIDHHDMAHRAYADDLHRYRKNMADQWFLKQFVAVIEALKNTPEGDGTMLDHSLVVFCNNFAEGASHSNSGVPFILAGSAGGYLKTGRYVRCGNWGTSRFDGGSEFVPQNGLLVSICKAMDVAPPTIDGEEYFGDPQFGTGELPGLTG